MDFGIISLIGNNEVGGRIIESVKLITVEVRKLCQCHRLVLARHLERPAWWYFFVKEPSWIEFGDRLLYYPETYHLFQDRKLLTYRARLDTVPLDVVNDLVETLPYQEMYPNRMDVTVVSKPPQGK